MTIVLLNMRVLLFIDAGRREHGKNEVVKSFRDRETFVRFSTVNPFPSLTTVFSHLKLRSSRANGRRISLVFFFWWPDSLWSWFSFAAECHIWCGQIGNQPSLSLIANSLLPPRERKVLAKGKHKRARGILGRLFSEGGSRLKVAARWNYIFRMGTNPPVFATLPVNSLLERSWRKLTLETTRPFSSRQRSRL